MPAKHVENARRTAKDLPRQVHLRVHYPPEEYLAAHPEKIVFALQYRDALDEDSDWIDMGEFRSLGEAQRAADKFLGREIPQSDWNDET